MQVGQLAKEGRFDYLVIESTGVAEPMQVQFIIPWSHASHSLDNWQHGPFLALHPMLHLKGWREPLALEWLCVTASLIVLKASVFILSPCSHPSMLYRSFPPPGLSYMHRYLFYF